MHSDADQSHLDFLQALKKAGFPSPTPLQEKLAPLVLKSRDVIVEPVGGTDSTAIILLSLILGLRGAGLAPHALLLVPSSQEVGKITHAVGRFTRVVRDVPSFVPLGEIEDARREQRRLEKGATIVAGTTERVIDHLRRGSLNVGELAAVVVQEPEGEGRADFIKDVQFIFARLSGRHQTVLFSALSAGEGNELLALLRHPVVLSTTSAVGAPALREKEYLVFETSGSDKAETLARVLLGRRIPTALVLSSPRVDPQRIAQALRLRLLRASAWPPGHGRPTPRSTAGGGAETGMAKPNEYSRMSAAPPGPAQRGRTTRSGEDRAAALAALSSGDADVVIATSFPVLSREESEGFSPSHVVYLDLPAGGSRSARWTSNIIALVDRGQEKEISRLQEAIGVTLKKEDLPTDDEVVIGAIDRVLRNLKGDSDKAGLARLRSLIRRQVPLLQRPLFMAYLLRSLLPPGSGREVGRPGQDTRGRHVQTAKPPRGRFGRSVDVPRPQGPRPQGPPPSGESGRAFTQLFVSIGRNRRVYARELTELFTQKLQLGANELGSVRVFDKYSFVDINAARADEAITKLTGSEVKGRTITVNYAKKKEEKEQR